MRKHFSTIILVIVFFVGLSVLLYPTVSNYINSINQSKAIIEYDNVLKNLTEEEYDTMIAGAEDYNRRLSNTSMAFFTPESVEGYAENLDVTGTGIMGYITIDKIDVMLPIYHGTSNEVLNVAVGHLEGSSLPVGGYNTHCVLSAHRGLPSAKLFTNLDKLEVGDTFTINVLNRLLTYEVSLIQIVEPDEVDSLFIQEGRDICTLVTCTPYGINTHRLLVHANRIENDDNNKQLMITADGYVIDPIIVTPIVASPMLMLLLIYLFVHYRKRKNNIKNKDIN